MLYKLDDFLNSFTMYRVILYGLGWLVGAALILSGSGVLQYSFVGMLISLGLILSVGFIVQSILGWLYKLPQNFESSLITCLILFFIMGIPASGYEVIGIVLAVVIALTSKYILTWRGANIFNPAAFGAFIASLTGIGFAAWWIATPTMLPFVILLGLIVLRKTRRFKLFFAFFAPALIIILLQGVDTLTVLTSWPLLFAGTIMLTEPSTMPSTNRKRLAYGVIVGLLLGSPFHIGPIVSSPHLALLVGNIFTLLVSTHSSRTLRFVRKTQLSPTTYDFAFTPPQAISYIPGQYQEWTLKTSKIDGRGNRRTFTIVSNPEDQLLHLVTKFYDHGSQFKQYLKHMEVGDYILAGRVAGDFILPKDAKTSLIFIAGGIGITPFVTMVNYLVSTNQKRAVTLLYFVANEREILFKNLWRQASKLGINVIFLVGSQNTLNIELLKKHNVDITNKVIYLSGPPAMVRNYKKVLKRLSVPQHKIRTDYFSGY